MAVSGSLFLSSNVPKLLFFACLFFANRPTNKYQSSSCAMINTWAAVTSLIRSYSNGMYLTGMGAATIQFICHCVTIRFRQIKAKQQKQLICPSHCVFDIMTAGMQAFCLYPFILGVWGISCSDFNCFPKYATPSCFPCHLTKADIFAVCDPCVICVAVSERGVPKKKKKLSDLVAFQTPSCPLALPFVLCSSFDHNG